MKAVLDANVFVSAMISTRGTPTHRYRLPAGE
jgi:predicted nucleic acid-binding protein